MNWKRIGVFILLLLMIPPLLEWLLIPSYADFLHWAFGDDQILAVGFTGMIIAVIVASMVKDWRENRKSRSD